MSVWLIVVLTILLFAVLIFSHEFGHLLFAKWSGIFVEEFAVGMGPKLLGFRLGETMYTLRLFPIGGYCKMPGEDGESEHENGFDKKSVPKRMLVVFGGAFFNFILAILIFIIVYMCVGVPSNSSQISDVSPGMPAAAAGLEAGDTILSVGDQPVATWTETVAAISGSEAGQPLTYTVQKADGVVTELQIASEYSEDNQANVIGILRGNEKLSFFGAIGYGFKRAYEVTALILVTLFQMLTGQIGVDLAGPIGVGQMVGQVAQYGIVNLLLFIALLSVNLGVVNLLPLPALDGSRLVFLAIEGIRGKAISAKIEGTIHLVGFALLMLLMVVITYTDILRLRG